MTKKIFVFGLLLFFGLTLLPKQTLAVLNPPDPVSLGAVGQIQAELKWTWPPGEGPGFGVPRRFVLSWREVPLLGPPPPWTKVYPSMNGPDYTFQLGGLVPNTNYEWTVKAQAMSDANSSNEVPAPPGQFTTESSGPGNGPPKNGDPGPGPGWVPVIINLENPLDADSLEEAIDALINLLFVLAFAIAPLLLIYAGFLILFRSDDPRERNKARTIIFWVLIALAIIVLAKALPATIKSILSTP
jgi:hypothetical protein